MYYVYEWFIVETGEVIYVGKGTKNRYRVRKHNKLFDEIIRSVSCESRIVNEFETEQEAFLYEYELSCHYKKIGQCKCNIVAGGSGGTTEWWDDEKRKWYSEHNAMKNKAQRERMSRENPMHNTETAERVGQKHQRGVMIGEMEFSSVSDAMEHYGVCHATIQKWCKKGINPEGSPCRYKDEVQREYTGRYNKGVCRPIIYNGKRYECAVDIGRELGLSNTTISKWAAKGFAPDGTPCRFEDETRELEYKPFVNGLHSRKPVVVNGKRYESVSMAEDDLGLKRGYLTPYLKGQRKNMKYICEYDNQQPSRGNTDKSTPEGSTTNG